MKDISVNVPVATKWWNVIVRKTTAITARMRYMMKKSERGIEIMVLEKCVLFFGY